MAEANRLITEANKLVERQRRAVVGIVASGRKSEEAETLFEMMTSLRDQMMRQRELLMEAGEALRTIPTGYAKDSRAKGSGKAN